MKSFTYKDAGVDIDAGNELIQRIKPAVESTRRDGCVGSIGGFGGMFEVPIDRYKKPLLVSGTDGVGTKLKLAIDMGKYDTIGVDLVAMCANDVAVLGAECLFFLDYYATGRLDVHVAEQVIKGIARGCEIAGCALIGGETAEMPGVYRGDDFDLAGFCVGIVEKDRVITGEHITAGNKIIALASSGPHSNGYSLIRKIIETSNVDLSDQMIEMNTIGDLLIQPTRIYASRLWILSQQISVLGAAHITGGGIMGNIPRILPDDCTAAIDCSTWDVPEIFNWIQKTGNVRTEEMFRTFNCGVGMVVIVRAEDCERALDLFDNLGEHAWEIGEVVEKTDGQTITVYNVNNTIQHRRTM